MFGLRKKKVEEEKTVEQRAEEIRKEIESKYEKRTITIKEYSVRLAFHDSAYNHKITIFDDYNTVARRGERIITQYGREVLLETLKEWQEDGFFAFGDTYIPFHELKSATIETELTKEHERQISIYNE